MSFKVQTKDQLDSYICHHWNDINKYISDLKTNLPMPFYSSVDIRESNVKYAPVDHNMYPAGFNNVCSMDLKDALPIFKSTILKLNQNAKHVGIIPESHTKNLFYLDHLHTLSQLVKASGFELTIITFDQSLFEEGRSVLNLTSQSGHEVVIHKASVQEHLIHANNYLIDTVIMNNDQSNPLPIDWINLKTQISPTPLIGWFRRQKNTHFTYYKKVIDEFCLHFSINPELLQAKFRSVDNIDFESKEGLEKLAHAVDDLKNELGPDSKMFVKASQGTYGMGISVVSSGEEIINMNRKTRNKMDVGKNSIKFTSILVQEGVETIIRHDSHPAEITIYLIDGECIGGFIRANTEKDSLGNLNSKGMIFKKICITDIGQDDESKCKEAIYSIIARMACIASALEIKEVL